MVFTKFVLVTTVIIVVNQCSILLINGSEILQSSSTTNDSNNNNNSSRNSANKLDDFKNKAALSKLIIPDISALYGLKETKANKNLNDLLTVWNVLQQDGNYEVTKDVPFTICVPKAETKQIETERLKEFLLEHLIPGEAFITFNDEDVYGNANKHEIIFKKLDKVNESMWTLNGFKIMRTAALTDKLSLIFIDGVLGDRKAGFAKRNIQETNRYNEPQKLEMKNVTKDEQIQSPKKDVRHNALLTFLAGMKSGTKVFQHFLTKSNLTQILDESPFTVLIPSDNAFQRWHPIDWGFYPFSVPDFTEGILRNHFLQLKTPLRMEDVIDMDRGQKYKTLGGEVVIFRNTPTPSVNNVSILADYTLPNGNEVFLISEVLFVSEAVVSRLHQMHKDKETPPLLAFPWFGAQFLSHSFLALERDSRFSQITRFLNTAEIAQYVSGANYTFFVPVDDAFEKLEFDVLPDDLLASDKGVKMLLCHFVKGRLYDRDLKKDEVFETIGGRPIRIGRQLPGNVTVNHANIIETEVFVYNLGTMFYIDQILYADILSDAVKSMDGNSNSGREKTTNNKVSTSSSDTEVVIPASNLPGESIEKRNNNNNHHNHNDDDEDADDSHFQDDEIITPRALPVRFANLPKK